MTQHLNFATHDSGTKPDLVLSLSEDLVSSVKSVGKLGSSDHVMIEIQVSGSLPDNNTMEMVPDWADWGVINEAIQAVDFTEQLEMRSGQEGWDFFKEVLNSVTENHIKRSKEELAPNLYG